MTTARLLLRTPVCVPTPEKLLQPPLLVVPRTASDSSSCPLEPVQVICLSEDDDAVAQFRNGVRVVVGMRPRWGERGVARRNGGEGREEGVKLGGERRAIGVVGG